MIFVIKRGGIEGRIPFHLIGLVGLLGLLEAHRRYRRAAAFWKHPSPLVATCDNPAKDGRGLTAAIWAGDGKKEWLFPGKVIVVETEAQCDEGFRCYDSEDFRIGYQAFLAKTAPDFVGR